jgi:hypothetical protein
LAERVFLKRFAFLRPVLALRHFVDLQISDRQNVELKSKCRRQ